MKRPAQSLALAVCFMLLDAQARALNFGDGFFLAIDVNTFKEVYINPSLRMKKDAYFVISKFNKGMVEAFSLAWRAAANGTSYKEGVILVLRMADGSYKPRFMGNTNQFRSFTFPWHPGAIAIIHTHPNTSDAKPQDDDIKAADKLGVPVFTITSRGMYVYDPTTRKTSKVRDGLDWLDQSKWKEKIALQDE
jgi:hypothetical protein